MKEQDGLRVVYVRGDEEFPAIVLDPGERPWRVHAIGSDGRDELPWEVVFMESGARTRVFDTSRTARAWAEARIRRLRWWFVEHGHADGPSEEANEKARRAVDDATERFVTWAAENCLDPENPETVRRAHREAVIGSVCLYSSSGCAGELPKVVPTDVGDVPSVIGWDPNGYHPTSAAILYEDEFGWLPGKTGRQTPVDTGLESECREVPHVVRSMRVE
jgi:hypothetical protein